MREFMLGFRVDKEEKDFLEKLADDEHRTTANFIRMCVWTYVTEKKGLNWPKNKRK